MNQKKDKSDSISLSFENLISEDLIEAAMHGDISSVKQCLRFKADPQYHNNYALRLAFKNNHLEIMHLLITAGANLACYNHILLSETVLQNKLDILKLFVRHDIDVNVEINTGEPYFSNKTTLLLMAIQNNFEEMSLFLIEQNAHIDEFAIVFSCSNGNVSITKKLLENPSLVSVLQERPLREAIFNEHFSIVDLLIESGANIQDALAFSNDVVKNKLNDYLHFKHLENELNSKNTQKKHKI